MLKYLLVGLIATLIYRFWNTKPKIDRTGQEPDEYIDYEELED